MGPAWKRHHQLTDTQVNNPTAPVDALRDTSSKAAYGGVSAQVFADRPTQVYQSSNPVPADPLLPIPTMPAALAAAP